MEQTRPARRSESMRWRRVLRWLAVRIAAAYALLCVVGHFGYRTFLYPAPQVDAVAPPSGARIVELRAADGVRVHAMEFANADAARTVVYFHGNGEVIGNDVWMAQRLVAQGF